MSQWWYLALLSQLRQARFFVFETPLVRISQIFAHGSSNIFEFVLGITDLHQLDLLRVGWFTFTILGLELLEFVLGAGQSRTAQIPTWSHHTSPNDDSCGDGAESDAKPKQDFGCNHSGAILDAVFSWLWLWNGLTARR